MIIVLASENRHKIEEIRSILNKEIDVKIESLVDYPRLRLPPETGATYRENAIAKAGFVATETGHWAMGDDSGLEVAALDGAPGLYSARYAGEDVSYADNFSKMLEALKDVPEGKRGARFVCTVAVAGPQGEVDVVEGICEGEITTSESGREGFGYDPIFFFPPAGKTFAELSQIEKNKVSHRGRALMAVLSILKETVLKID